ncbi:hypothetical protein Hanom_Chr16g01474391 [Helianthus anomalus]
MHVCIGVCVCEERGERPILTGCGEPVLPSRRSGGRCGGPTPVLAGPQSAPIPTSLRRSKPIVGLFVLLFSIISKLRGHKSIEEHIFMLSDIH